MNILITGVAGFIGNNFICYYLEKYRDKKIIGLYKLTLYEKYSLSFVFEEGENYV